MTRLTSEWISGMEEEMTRYDRSLKKRTGMGLGELAAKAVALDCEDMKRKLEEYTAAAIPITSGQGVIGSFADSVAAILRTAGAKAFVPGNADVSGIHEAVGQKADILFMADDDRYIALNVKNGRFADNNHSTALGYVTALEAMAGPLRNRKVLVVGCGVVGRLAAGILKQKGALVYAFDKDGDKAKEVPADEILASLSGLNEFGLIFDATNEGGWIKPGMLSKDTYIASPGVPLSLDANALMLHEGTLIHDLLQIGTAVMLAEVL